MTTTDDNIIENLQYEVNEIYTLGDSPMKQIQAIFSAIHDLAEEDKQGTVLEAMPFHLAEAGSFLANEYLEVMEVACSAAVETIARDMKAAA